MASTARRGVSGTGQMGRRRFLHGSAALGASTLAPISALHAQEEGVDPATTLRCQMRVIEIGDPRLFNQSEQANIARGTLENLIRYTDSFELEPWLLSRWETSEDGKVITLHLREGVTWTNGDPFTSKDVVHNFRRWSDRSVEGNSMADRMAALIDPGTGQLRDGAVRIVDALTVRLTLEQPDVTLIPGLADYPALIVHRLFDEEGGSFPGRPIGTGPYHFEDYTPGARAVLTRREDWWGGTVPIERIEYVDLGIDPSNYQAAFEAGEIDMTYDSTGSFVGLFDDMNLVHQEVLSGATIVFRVNRTSVPEDHPYRDARVRRALAMAVDNAVILELGYSDLGAVAENHHVGPMNPDYVDIGAPEPDPAAAFALMKEAGAERFEHELISLDDDWNRASADAVAAQLRDAGFKVRRRVMTSAEYWAGWATHPFSCTAWNMRPLGLQVLRLAYASDGVWNETGFASADFDRLLAQAIAEPDDDARKPMMAALQQMLIDDGTIIQPYWRKLFLHHNVRVIGLKRHPTNEHHHDKWGLVG